MIEAVRLGACTGEGVLWEDLDLVVGDGDFLIVTGPPSCGKTVLAGILRGERRPDTGDVLADGKPIYRDSGAAREFLARTGSIAEAMPVRHGLTVRGLFDIAALAAGRMPAAERRAREEELLAIFGMAGASGRDPRSLSTSERARVALAAELLRGPRFLFADRLLENAGIEWADRIVALFRALAKEGKTIMAFERTIGARWAPEGDEGVSSGPFRIIRASPGGELPR